MTLEIEGGNEAFSVISEASKVAKKTARISLSIFILSTLLISVREFVSPLSGTPGIGSEAVGRMVLIDHSGDRGE